VIAGCVNPSLSSDIGIRLEPNPETESRNNLIRYLKLRPRHVTLRQAFTLSRQHVWLQDFRSVNRFGRWAWTLEEPAMTAPGETRRLVRMAVFGGAPTGA
jgi:hypothetical protein